MTETNWKQNFFSKAEPIAMRDPLAAVLGAIADDEPIYYEYSDCVKVAGHACASVTTAFMMTKVALKELYGTEIPVRGEIDVRYAGARDQGANGPIGQVIQFLTGAAIETGFHGLGGKFVRADRFAYDENFEGGDGITAEYTRMDTGDKVVVVANPSVIPMDEEVLGYSNYIAKVIQGIATDEEREKFYKYWQGKNREILLEDHPGVFEVTKLS